MSEEKKDVPHPEEGKKPQTNEGGEDGEENVKGQQKVTLSPAEQVLALIMDSQKVTVKDTDMAKEKADTVVQWTRQAMAEMESQYYTEHNINILKRMAETSSEPTEEKKSIYDGSLNINNIFMNRFKELALTLKKKLDAELSGTWHVICGTSFGSNVTSDKEMFLNFQVNTIYFLVMQSGPPERPVLDDGNAKNQANATTNDADEEA